MDGQYDLNAGDFYAWLVSLRNALQNDTGTDVPCGACNACCRSSYFIHIKPTEKAALDRINKRLLFPAPGFPRGHQVLGYDETGRCPMFENLSCSIYENRPMTCRYYDCRIFAATEIPPGEDEKVLIAQQVSRWKFTFPEHCDKDWHSALQVAVHFIREHTDRFPEGTIPGNPTQLAVFAIKVCDVFLGIESLAVCDISKKVHEVMEAAAKFGKDRESKSRKAS